MSERKNIDRLFQERFKDFEAEPSEQAWKNIEARLEEKNNRKVIPFWFKLTGVAAVLLIGLFVILNGGTENGQNNGTGIVNGGGNPNAVEDSVAVPNGNIVNPQNAVTENDGANGSSAPSGLQKTDSTANPADRISNPANPRDNASGLASSSDKKAKQNASSKRHDLRNGVGNENEQQYAVSEEKAQKRNVHRKSKRKSFDADRNQVAHSNVNQSGSRKNEDRTRKTAGNDAGDLNKPAQTQVAQTPEKSQSNKTFKNENQIAVNENNQSGKTDAQNSEVTEKTTTSTQAIAAQTDDKKTDSTGIATVEEPNALEELLKNEKENKSVTENEPKINRWQVASKVAPIYLSSASNGSPIDSRFAENDKDYKTKLSYGMGVSYALNDRLSVRAGVNSLAFEYNTTGVVAKQSFVGSKQLEHVTPTLQGAFVKIENKEVMSAPELGSNGTVLKEFNSSISQKTGYIEVPVELTYKVLNKRFGIDVIGGFSTLFLSQNEVSVVTPSSEMDIGKANNLNDTSFSGNVGVGLSYNIWKALRFNVEPMFKYQFNTYTQSGNFKPYFFGIYTGLNYRF